MEQQSVLDSWSARYADVVYLGPVPSTRNSRQFARCKITVLLTFREKWNPDVVFGARSYPS